MTLKVEILAEKITQILEKFTATPLHSAAGDNLQVTL